MLAGEIPEEEMKRVFNMGIGYCLVVPRNVEQETIDLIRGFHDWDAWVIGQVK
jgi:phosphoribosylformylglycinamidine cyclo-ligase